MSMMVQSGRFTIGPPTRVQEGPGLHTFSVTLGAAPASANWLIALGYRVGPGGGASAPPVVNTGWTSFSTHNRSGASDPWVTLAYKQAGAGESATQTPFTGSGTGYGVAIIEVANLASPFSSRVQYSNYAVGSGGGGAGTLTVSQNHATSAADTLAIGLGNGTSAASSGTWSSPVISGGGWTNTVASVSNPGGTGEGAWIGSQAVPVSGTTITLTTSVHFTNFQASGMTNMLLFLNNP